MAQNPTVWDFVQSSVIRTGPNLLPRNGLIKGPILPLIFRPYSFSVFLNPPTCVNLPRVKMYVKSSFSGTWKYQKRKPNFKSYTTLGNLPQNHHDRNIVSTNKAITAHAKNGELDIARNMFDQMRQRTVVSWNTMISGYLKCGKSKESLSLLSVMHHSNVRLNEMTFLTGLSACARLSALPEGRQIHGLVLKSGLENFELVGSALLHLYSNCYEIEEANQVFDVLSRSNGLLWSSMLVGYVQCDLMDEALGFFNKMRTHDTVAWTTLISGFSKKDDGGCEKALKLFQLMRENGEAVPNEFTLDCVLRACGKVRALREGWGVHGLLIRYGFEYEHSIGGALIDLYCNCRSMDDAKRAYDGIVSPGVNESNRLIEGLVAMCQIEEAELVFNGLDKRNSVTYNLMLKGYSICGRFEDSKAMFLKMPERNLVSLNTMISVYSGSGELDKALELFEETKEEKNPVTWNSMISGYVHYGQHENALKLYMTMHRLYVGKTRSTFSALFYACSCLGSLQQGQLLHAHLVKTPYESNVYVGTALVDMYSKFGSIIDTQSSFINISKPNVAAWTALINGYAHHGLSSEVILLLEQMLKQGIKPNAATFVGVLSACARGRLVNEGMGFLYMMKERFGVTPTLEHYTCAVDLLGRSGFIRDAEELIKEMPIEADRVVWGALLNACWFWMDMETGERAAEKMTSLQPKPISAYIIMSNMYAALGRWREKMKVRNILRGLEVKKDPGCSWIVLNNKNHVFSVEDRTHSCCNIIYSTLEHLTANVNSIIQLDTVTIHPKPRLVL